MAGSGSPDHFFKVGESLIGKTSSLRVLASGEYDQSQRPTISADFTSKEIELEEDVNKTVMLQVWDTPGDEKFVAMTGAHLYV